MSFLSGQMMDDLSPPEDKPRTAREVAERCIVLLAVVAAGHTIDRSKLTQWLRREEVWPSVSPEEVEFFKSAAPTQRQIINATWRAEALYVLLWALDRVMTLPSMRELCDLEQLQDAMPNVFTPTREFMERRRSVGRKRSQRFTRKRVRLIGKCAMRGSTTVRFQMASIEALFRSGIMHSTG